MGSLKHLFLFFFFIGLTSSSSISHEVIAPHGSLGRSLLQQKTACSTDMENLNYTTVTSQCQGPNYPPETCCNVLKQMVCPYKTQINDPSTDCADTFFGSLNAYGNYAPGLLSALCQKGEQLGIDCDGYILNVAPPGPRQEDGASLSSHVQLIFLFAGLLMHMFLL